MVITAFEVANSCPTSVSSMTKLKEEAKWCSPRSGMFKVDFDGATIKQTGQWVLGLAFGMIWGNLFLVCPVNSKVQVPLFMKKHWQQARQPALQNL